MSDSNNIPRAEAGIVTPEALPAYSTKLNWLREEVEPIDFVTASIHGLDIKAGIVEREKGLARRKLAHAKKRIAELEAQTKHMAGRTAVESSRLAGSKMFLAAQKN